MERTAVCSICGGLAKPAYSCSLCGALCCSNCFKIELKLCINCAAKVKR